MAPKFFSHVVYPRSHSEYLGKPLHHPFIAVVTKMISSSNPLVLNSVF